MADERGTRETGVTAAATQPARAPSRTLERRGSDDVSLGGTDAAFGLRLPAGSARTVVLADSIDARVAMPLARVAGHVRAQLTFPLVEETAADGLRYPAARLADAPDAPPITVLILPMPRGDVLIRVRRLGAPQQPVDPLTAQRLNE